MATSPSGVQIYLATSLTFTLVQSVALRNEGFRKLVSLPSMKTEGSVQPELAMGFQKLKMKEREAAKARGDKEVLGKGVLAPGWSASFEGFKRASSIDTSTTSKNVNFPNTSGFPGMLRMQMKTPSLMIDVPKVLPKASKKVGMSFQSITSHDEPKQYLDVKKLKLKRRKINKSKAKARSSKTRK